MSELYERIESICKVQGISVTTMCKNAGVSRASLTDLKKGRNQTLSTDTLTKIAAYFETTIGYLLGTETEKTPAGLMPMPKFVKKPRLGTIACGDPKLAVENAEEFDWVPEEVDCDFTLQCKGDSMVNARIMDGDIVYIKAQTMVENGEIAAVLIGEETTLKRVYYDKENNVLQLMPENPAYPIMRFIGPELDQIRIIGKAVKFMSTVV